MNALMPRLRPQAPPPLADCAGVLLSGGGELIEFAPQASLARKITKLIHGHEFGDFIQRFREPHIGAHDARFIGKVGVFKTPRNLQRPVTSGDLAVKILAVAVVAKNPFPEIRPLALLDHLRGFAPRVDNREIRIIHVELHRTHQLRPLPDTLRILVTLPRRPSDAKLLLASALVIPGELRERVNIVAAGLLAMVAPRHHAVGAPNLALDKLPKIIPHAVSRTLRHHKLRRIDPRVGGDRYVVAGDPSSAGAVVIEHRIAEQVARQMRDALQLGRAGAFDLDVARRLRHHAVVASRLYGGKKDPDAETRVGFPNFPQGPEQCARLADLLSRRIGGPAFILGGALAEPATDFLHALRGEITEPLGEQLLKQRVIRFRRTVLIPGLVSKVTSR